MQKVTQKLSSLVVLTVLGVSLSSTSARAVTPITATTAAFLIHSAWMHFSTFPTDAKQVPNRYDLEELKQALKEFARGENV